MRPFELRMVSPAGNEARAFYNPWTSALTDASGRDLLEGQTKPRPYDVAGRVRPEQPSGKGVAPVRLKIQLGLGCNYECSYCVQTAFRNEAEATSTADTREFLEALERRLDLSRIKQIELWGGEPLLYWRKLEILVPAIRERLPDVKLLMITNGALLDETIVAWIMKYNIAVAMSHDGPGQPLRGPDPLENPVVLAAVRGLHAKRGKGFSINSVLSAENHDIGAIRGWIRERIAPDVQWNLEGVVHDYSAAPRAWTPEQYRELRLSVLEQFITDKARDILSMWQTAEDFVESLRTRRPAAALWQSCGMDKPDQLVTDLAGNVLTCQNVGTEGGHKIGNLDALPDVRLTTSTHWSHRDECNHCPVLQLCKGSCMFQTGDGFAVSCENEWHYKSAILQGAIYLLTGYVPVDVYGDIRRPRPSRRIIPIKALAGGANAGPLQTEVTPA
jgi:uncharacterized protein